jgi:uncharacterized protein
MTVLAFDRSSARSYDAEGRLRVADCRLTRACVSPYRGDEIPDYNRLGLDPSRIYHLLRDPDALRRAVPAFAGLPILSKHQPATAYDHPADITVGAVGTDVRWEDPWIVASLSFWPNAAIERIQSGEAKDLSVGYGYRPLMRSGTFEGEHYYDGVMLDIVPNHLSVIPDGRVEGAMVGDAALYGRRKLVRHFSTFRGIYLAADAAIRRRKARDAEPDNAELDNEPATVDDLVAIVAEWLADMPPDEAEELLKRLGDLSDTDNPEMAYEMAAARDRARHGADRTRGLDDAGDRARRGVPGARGAGDRHRHAHDSRLPAGVKPASERFGNIGRSTSLGGGRNDGITA